MAENKPLFKYSDLVFDDGTFEMLLANIKKSEVALLSLAKSTKKAFSDIKPGDTEGIEKREKAIKEVELAERNLIKTTKALQKAKKKSIALTNEELVQREKEKLQQKERVQRAKQQAIIQREEKNNIASLRAQLALTTLDWKKFTAAELANTKEGRKLVKNKRDLTKQLKKLEKATGDNRRNVGNYSSALRGLNGIMVGFGGSTFIAATAVVTLATAIKATTKGMNKFKLALIGTGIGALVVAFGALIAFLTRTQRGLDFVSQAFAAVTTTIDVIIDRISKFGEAIGAAFSGDFAKAARLFKESVSGIGDEIAKETAAALELERATQAQIKAQRILRLERAKGALQIATLLRKAEENKNINKKLSEEQLREALAIQQKISNAEVKFAKENLRIIQGKIALGETLNDELDKEVDLIIAVGAADKAREDAIRGITRKINSLTGVQKDNTKEIEKNTKAAQENAKKRLAAIDSLLKQISVLEANSSTNIKERTFALEELRFKEEQAIRVSQFKELEALTIAQGEDLAKVQGINQTLSEKQLEAHEQKKNDIRKKFAIQTIEIEALTEEKLIQQRQEARDKELAQIGLSTEAIKDLQETVTEAQNEAIAEQNKAREEANAKQKKDSEKLINGIKQSAQKVGAIIVDLFRKQADLSAESVNEQSQNLERARDRAQKGLSANLAFEENQLSKRQLEQQRREKEAAQAAKILTLFNLVSAYAAGGDKNALSRGLVDFALLTALSAGLGAGLYEGSEDIGKTSNPLDSKGGRLYKLHDNERVVPKYLNTMLSGMSNEDMVANAVRGSQHGDYFEPQSLVQTNPYKAQKESFKQEVKADNKADGQIVKTLQSIEKKLASQPNYSAQIVEVQEGLIQLIVRTKKQTLTKVQKMIIRGNK